MILHIHDSSSLFINLSISCFEKADIPSVHVVVGSKKTKDYGDAKFLKLHSKEYRSFFNEIPKEFNFVLFHSLLGSCEKTLLYIKNKNIDIIKGWVIYGAEMQNSRVIPSSFLGAFTKYYYYLLLPYRVLVPFYRILRKLIKGNLRDYLNYIDYYAHFMPEEVEVVKEETKIDKPMLWHSYIMTESYFENKNSKCFCNRDGGVFIGNSASFTSNHLEAFLLVKKVLKQSNSKRNIVVPLSYGNKIYSNFIQRKGRKMFSDSFIPLTMFLDKDKYHSTLMTCSIMILNNKRQQALGNLIAGSWYGMRVYVCEKTSSYKFFIKKGLLIFSLENDFNESNPNCFISLSEKETFHNRKILIELFGEDAFVSSLRGSFNPFISHTSI